MEPDLFTADAETLIRRFSECRLNAAAVLGQMATLERQRTTMRQQLAATLLETGAAKSITAATEKARTDEHYLEIGDRISDLQIQREQLLGEAEALGYLIELRIRQYDATRPATPPLDPDRPVLSDEALRGMGRPR